LRDYFAAQAPIYLDDAFECLQNSTKATLTEKYDGEVIDALYDYTTGKIISLSVYSQFNGVQSKFNLTN